MSCRDKDNGCDDCGQLSPPYGIIASAVGGELAFFNLVDLRPIRSETLAGWATACEIVPSGGRLVATDNDAGALSVLTIPEMESLEHISIGGTPVDVRVARNSLTAHLLTHNSRYYRISLNSIEVDTVDTGLEPRRLKLRPGDHWAWIACPGDSTVRVIKEQGFFEERRLVFTGPCTDVEFSPNGVLAYCALPGSDQLMVLEAQNGEPVDTFAMPGTVVDLSVSSDGRYVMAVDSNHGVSRVIDVFDGITQDIQCGTSAIRVRYSSAARAFFVVCPRQNMVLRVNPYSTPPAITDTIFVEPIPQCLSFLE